MHDGAAVRDITLEEQGWLNVYCFIKKKSDIAGHSVLLNGFGVSLHSRCHDIRLFENYQ